MKIKYFVWNVDQARPETKPLGYRAAAVVADALELARNTPHTLVRA
jgi:hypothetical protein